MTTVGSRHTGRMTRDRWRSCLLGFSADLVLQGFLPHRRLTPKPVDLKTHAELPIFIQPRAASPCGPATASSHLAEPHCSCPNTVGTGGEATPAPASASPSRAGSGLVALPPPSAPWPLDMPESRCCAVHRLAPARRHPARCGELRSPMWAIQKGLCSRGQSRQGSRLLRGSWRSEGCRSQAGAGV